MNDLILYEEDINQLNAILYQFIQDAKLSCAFLTNKEGQLLTCYGETQSIDSESVAALITGSFSATVTIAHLIGESEFSSMFHRGKNRHIHISLVDQNRYLASIFGNDSSVEQVSYYASLHSESLRQYLVSISDHAETARLPSFSLNNLDTNESEQLQESFETFCDTMQSEDTAAYEFHKDEADAEAYSPGGPDNEAEVSENALPQKPVESGASTAQQTAVDATTGKEINPDEYMPPSNTAYLRIKIREAKDYKKKKSYHQDLISKLFGKRDG
ncbi:MAG: hypothetical protein GF398_16205 [Chitinivibrionales bacterium]|nr:hypothetical protein [Chitinivibrionales bacterium]